METIANAVVSFFELVEAEGRNFRQKAVLVFEGFLLMFFGVSLVLFGVVAAGAAFYIWLSFFIGRSAAALLVAVILVAMGVLLLSKGRKYSSGGGGSVD